MARARRMRKSEQARLTWLATSFVLAHGGHFTEPPTSNPINCHTLAPGGEMTLPTACGPLRVVPYGNWIACRFADVARAVARLGKSAACGRLNPFSGKFNLTFGPITAEDAFAEFEADMLPLLESREPSTVA